MRRNSLLALLVAGVLVAGCGDDDDSDGLYYPIDAGPQPDVATIDGGDDIDAGPSIDGGIDAGPTIDGGIDAGAPDAAPPDASLPDAGAPDAGAPDAQSFDAAPPVDDDIRDLQDGTVALGSQVRVAGPVVTARTDTSTSSTIFIQEPTGDASFSGIFVFVPLSPAPGFTLPSVGDVVVLEGTLEEFTSSPASSRTNIVDVTSITVMGTAALPAPVLVPAAELVGGTTTAEQWEGVLVRVEHVTVASIEAGFKEFLLAGGPEVDDRLFAYPMPLAGDTYEAIVGPLDEGFGSMRILPRTAGDLIGYAALPPVLTSLTPPTVTVSEGEATTLTVTLDRAAPAGGASVALASSAEAVATVSSSTVIVAAGTATATFTVNALTSGSADITATFAGVSKTSAITVDSAPAEVADLTPGTLELLAAGGTGILTVSLTKPAPAGGFTVALTSSDAGVAVPAQVVVPEGELSVGFRLRADSLTAIGPVTISADTATADVSVVLAGSPPGGGDLVINEVNYDPAPGLPGDASCNGSMDPEDDEFVEIVNYGTFPVDMTGVSLRDGTASRFVFPAFVMGPGEVVVVYGQFFGTDTTAAWCKDLTASTISGARVFTAGSAGLNLGNSGDSVRLFASVAPGAAELTAVVYANNAASDMSLTRSPDIIGNIVRHSVAPGHATDRVFTPGTLLTGAPFAAASP